MKKFKIIATIVIFLLSFPIHFAYGLFPNNISSIFFPTNESIFEHMKIIASSIILYGIIEFFLFKKFKIPFNNFFTNLFLTSFLSIVIYLIIYIPLYLLIGENLFISIFLLLIVYGISQVISYFILTSNHNKGFNTLSLFLIILMYIVFYYLTNNPPDNFLFIDPTK